MTGLGTSIRSSSSIGPKLRELRLQRRLSLQQLAERADVSRRPFTRSKAAAWCRPSPPSLKLAAALDVRSPISSMRMPSTPIGHLHAWRRPRHGLHVTRGIDLAGISGRRQVLCGRRGPPLWIPAPGSGPTPMEHAGEELVYVLDGGLEFVVDGPGLPLAPGDALHWRTDRRHQWRNPGKPNRPRHLLALRPAEMTPGIALSPARLASFRSSRGGMIIGHPGAG